MLSCFNDTLKLSCKSTFASPAAKDELKVLRYKYTYRVSNNYCPIRCSNSNELMIGKELSDIL